MSCPLCRCIGILGILLQTHLNYTHTHTHTEDERAITSSSLALGNEPWAHWPLGDVGSLHHWQQPGAGSKRGSRVWSGACVSWSLLRIIAKWHTGQSGGSGTAWCSAVTQTTPGQSTAAITHYEAAHDFKNNNYWTWGSVLFFCFFFPQEHFITVALFIIQHASISVLSQQVHYYLGVILIEMFLNSCIILKQKQHTMSMCLKWVSEVGNAASKQDVWL